MSLLTKKLEHEKLELKNRLVMPPIATSKASSDGKVTPNILSYYDEKSKGGYISLLIIEQAYIADQGKAGNGQLSISRDEDVEGLKKLVDTVHKNGSKAVIQINHSGSSARKIVTGQDSVGPSQVENPRNGRTPIELTKNEIEGVIEAFKNAAVRAKDAGFDGVEIHAAHGYLLNQFFSPLTNKREDEYGGDLNGRIKIHLDIIKAIRDAVGVDFPILLRLAASDYMDGGVTIEDSKIACVEFEKAGVDILDISAGFSAYADAGLKGQGFFAPLTAEIKKVVSVPVVLAGGITELDACEKLLSEGKADLIAVGRAIDKDSNWAKNAIEA